MSSELYPAVELRSRDGARATIALDGAHVTSWHTAGSDVDRLFVSANSAFGPGASIRGGIPVIFPQFAAEGPLPRHGFARTSRWTVVAHNSDASPATATLQLVDNEQTRAVWPFAFRLQLTVHISAMTLEATLAVENTDPRPFEFTAALHSYLRVHDALHSQIVGLQGRSYRDSLRNRVIATETEATLKIVGEIDRVYFDVQGPLVVQEATRALRVSSVGFPDAVVWNPGQLGTRGRADFVPGDEREMLCVEAAAVQRPILLEPGARWEGTQRVTAENQQPASAS